MTRDWKPGDVALIPFARGEVRCMWTEAGWVLSDHGQTSVHNFSDARPLVVIDPEDREQVSRLADAFCRERWDHRPGSSECDPLTRLSMQNALHALANPTPPKPDEPQGLGAVVEDEGGDRWVRRSTHPARSWSADTGSFQRAADYADIAAVRVLSEGVIA